ncbi:MAG TPA: FtsX-like permease family protein [Bryobacteraceae bacterium]|nr:FtsX-like permease family protein [Bryobacteraceae bacterium]
MSAVIHAMDLELAIAELGTMHHWVERSVARPRFQAQLLAGFAGLALLLAVVGIYGVISYGAAQRTHEIGVRMSLGVRREDVAGPVLGKGAQVSWSGADYRDGPISGSWTAAANAAVRGTTGLPGDTSRDGRVVIPGGNGGELRSCDAGRAPGSGAVPAA